MQDSREKDTGIRDQDPPPLPDPDLPRRFVARQISPTINQAHSIPWFERRHHLALAWLIRFCRRLLFPLLPEYFCH